MVYKLPSRCYVFLFMYFLNENIGYFLKKQSFGEFTFEWSGKEITMVRMELHCCDLINGKFFSIPIGLYEYMRK